MPEEKTISEIVLLVHPLYSFTEFAEELHKRPVYSQAIRKNVSFFLGRWGKEIKKAGENKQAIVVIIVTGTVHGHYNKQLDDFIKFAERILGQRLFIMQDKIHPNSLRREIERRGFNIDPIRLHGKSFGEYLHQCVLEEASRARVELSHFTTKEVQLRPEPKLSLGTKEQYSLKRRRRK